MGCSKQKLWNREHKPKPPQSETPEQKKQRRKIARKAARQQPFEEKESYRWVEAIEELEHKVESSTRVIHVFDREGDITEVFDTVRQLKHTGLLVRASHNRSLDQNSQRLWDFMTSRRWRLRFYVGILTVGVLKSITKFSNLAVRANAIDWLLSE